MSRPRAISPENRPTTKYDLSDGDWVILFNKLDYGASSELYDATYLSGVGTTQQGTQRQVRMADFNITRIRLYVKDWSLIDDKNQRIPLTVEGIRRIDPETAQEVHDKINDLEEANRRAEQEGNAQAATATPSVSKGSSPARQAGGSQAESSG